MLEYMKGFNEDSTGWTRYNQGSDGDTLNHTATGVNLVTSRADMRLDLIARNMAEGFRELFRLMLKLVSQYQQREDIVRLRGQWVPVNPREWRNGFDCIINVGLGTGNKDQTISHLLALAQQQQAGMQIGTANAQNVLELQKELAKAMGFRSPDKFFSGPAQMPDPNEAAMSQLQAQLQAQLQIEQQKMQMQQQTDIVRQRAEMEQQQAKVASEAQLAQMEASLKAEVERARLDVEKWRAQLDSNTRIYLEQMKLGVVDPASVPALVSPETRPVTVQLQETMLQTQATIAETLNALRAAIEQMRAPRRIIRDENGRAQGVV